jgi:spore coat protein U-like protein
MVCLSQLARKKRKAFISAGVGMLALMLSLPSAPTHAATTLATFAITALVQSTCQITATVLNFPAYTGAISEATSTISLTCTNSTTYHVGLNAGTAAGASITNRMMTGTEGAQMPYMLYSDAGRTVNWGDAVGTNTVDRTGSGDVQALTVYGRLFAGKFVILGNCSDTIVATVTY